MKERDAIVAGSFYPDSASELSGMLRTFIKSDSEKKDHIAIVAPHAGYVYSGGVAGETYSLVNIPPTAIILAPNHTGRGKRISLYPGDAWNTPLGRVPVNKEINSKLLSECELIEEDEFAHLGEHSAEVQVPFLQYLRSDISISVVIISTQDYAMLSEIGSAIASVIKAHDEKVLIVASSDMTHFETQFDARMQDEMAISRIEAMDPKGLLETVVMNRISMCGVSPVTATLKASIELGATSAKLVKYQTSGDITGDTHSVVGYAGLVIK